MIKAKRIYLPAEAADGYRVLVDRLWPRGIKKDDARLDEWLKDIAPSPDLRRWYDHQVELWPEFQSRYGHELASEESLAHIRRLADLGRRGPVTLLFASRDEERNSAMVLLEALQAHPGLRRPLLV